MLALADAVALGLADRAHPPRAVAGAPAAVGRHRQVVAARRQRPRPESRLGQALGVEDDLALGAQVLAGLLDGGNVTLPRDVHRHVVLGRLDDHPQLAQRLEHLDPERPHGDVAPVPQGRRGPHDVLGASEPHVDERVDDAEVRVLPQPEDGEPVVVARVHVEVVAVVEVAITCRWVRNELGRLVDRVVVPRAECHDGPQQQAQPAPQPPATGAPHIAASRLAGTADGGEHGKQAARPDVAVGTGGRRIGVGHGPPLVEDGVTGRAAIVVDRHVEHLRGEPKATPGRCAYGWAKA